MKGIHEFMAEVGTNAGLQNEMRALEGQPYDNYYAAVVELGAKHGYTFSAEDVETTVDDLIATSALKGGELTDEQLESVAGGKGGGRAIGGIVEAIAKSLGGRD